MKIRFVPILISFLFCACSGVQVVYDYDKKADFTQFKTYDYYPNMKSGLSQLDEKRLFRNIDSVMQTKGYKNSPSADLYINIETSNRPKPVNSSVGIGIGGSNRNIGGGVSVGVPLGQQDQYRQIIFDLVDVDNDELIWQAVSEGTVSESMTPAVREAKIKEVVEKVFSKYPPQK